MKDKSIRLIIISQVAIIFSLLFLTLGFVPIVKKIRNTEDQWEQMEKYITQHSFARFSHGICPDCARQLYPDFNADKMKIAQIDSADGKKPQR